MLQIIDLYAATDSARGVNLETIIETGMHLSAEVDIDPAEIDSEPVQAEIERLDRELSEEYLRVSKAAEAVEAGDTQLTPQEELRLERLLETRNLTEASRIIGVELTEVSNN